MKRSKFADEQTLVIVNKGEASLKIANLRRTKGITEQTYYRWKAKYVGIREASQRSLL
jgi:putative transposase